MLECGQQELKDDRLNDFLNKTDVPVIVLMNKIDLSQQEKLEIEMNRWHEQLPKASILPLSALHAFNVDSLKQKIIELLPESPPYYPKDSMTDKSERFFVEEKIREKILLLYDQEVPYSTEIEVESFKDEQEIIKIRAIIYVSRESQKGIIIGKEGKMLKKVGTYARKDLEEFFQKKIYLELYVKVNKDWRNDEKQLKKFGYL